MCRCVSESEASWMHSVPPGLAKRLKGNVLVSETILDSDILYTSLLSSIVHIHVH